jgi:hypothetical protein
MRRSWRKIVLVKQEETTNITIHITTIGALFNRGRGGGQAASSICGDGSRIGSIAARGIT